MSSFALDRPWTVYLIHHSHTDIGYTQMQSRVARYHADFLDQALAIVRGADRDPTLSGFTWTNECFWSIEQWLARRGSGRVGELAEAIRSGGIGLTATYLHFSELVDERLLRIATERSVSFARAHGLPLDTALSADVNGFSWGYAQVLLDAGIENLLTCVHSHHGLAPIGKRQFPFFWETPRGGEILVWNGEHYNLGNALGLAPGAALTYGFTDELHPAMRLEDTTALAGSRLPRYLRQLEKDGYPVPFVLLQAGGTMSDNAPPSAEIARFANAWNARHSAEIRIEMTTPTAFSRIVREQFPAIPRHRGDWPDWWSDGFASMPAEVRLAREAGRTGRWARPAADREKFTLPADLVEKLDQNLLLFAEHTFNHSDSIASPWSLIGKGISGVKRAAAALACEAAGELQDEVQARLGELPNQGPETDERFFYKVVNPFDETVTDLAALYLEKRDFSAIPHDPEVVEAATGRVVACDRREAPRGLVFEVPVTLAPGASALFELRAGTAAIRSLSRNFTEECARNDVAGAESSGFSADTPDTVVETDFLRMEFDRSGALTVLRDRGSGLDLLAPAAPHGAFVPVYEITPVDRREGARMADVRRSFGRNRKGPDVRRSVGKVTDFRIGPDAHHHIPVVITHALDGVEWLRVALRVSRGLPRIDVAITLQKHCVWEPENLYLSLPFGIPGGRMWIDKPGGPLRPWEDQLPDTLCDWYALQEGYCVAGTDLGIAVATPDSPLLQLGPLEPGVRAVMGHPSLQPERMRPYAWLMTNYWETNFEASLAGFHEFTFRIEWGPHLSDPRAALERCALLNQGLYSFRTAGPPAE